MSWSRLHLTLPPPKVHIKAGHDICYHLMHQAISELHDFLTHRRSPASAALVDLDSPQSEADDLFGQIVALLSQSTLELFNSNRKTARTIKVHSSVSEEKCHMLKM